jgi:hypothetical protein
MALAGFMFETVRMTDEGRQHASLHLIFDTGCGIGLVCAARRYRMQFGKGSNLPLPL